MSDDNAVMPNLDVSQFHAPSVEGFTKKSAEHKPKILLLYGSLRTRSFSRLVVEESARLLDAMGAETKVFDPTGLPLPDGDDATHPKVVELREMMMWSQGQVWCSPERHGAMTGILKSQIDWVPLNLGGVRPTQGKTLAVMQVCGGSRSFNAVNQMRILGRWMRMITIPNQSSVPKAFLEFDEAGRMKPGPLYERVVDVCEELMKFTLLTRERADDLDVDAHRAESSGEGVFQHVAGLARVFPDEDGMRAVILLKVESGCASDLERRFHVHWVNVGFASNSVRPEKSLSQSVSFPEPRPSSAPPT